MVDKVVLVDEQDNEVGTMEKMEAHEKALLHRAFSVFIFNSKGQMLLQQRALSKYHSGGLWTNACCSHPYPNEAVELAATRRLQEEMGFVTPLNKAFTFTYKAAFDNGLTEHEYDHVFIGRYEDDIIPNEQEVANYCYKSVDEIVEELQSHAVKYTSWFKIALPQLQQWMKQNNFN
jgi:isopentenyl-diphosphate Delta-isomerase